MAVDAQTREELEAQLQELVNQQANPTTDYFNKMKQLQAQRSDISFDDITSRATELSALMPQTKGRGLYGLATDLSKGLLASANSRTPLGTGLAMGLNLYSDAATLRQKKADEIRSKLMQMAYQDVEKRKQEARDLDIKMLDVNFEYEVERLKNSGSNLPGKGDKAAMINWLMKGARLADKGDKSFLSTWEYRTSYAELQRERVQTLPDGSVYVIPGASWVKQYYPEPIITEDGNPVNEPGQISVTENQGSASNSPGNVSENMKGVISRVLNELRQGGMTNPQYLYMDPNGSGKPVFSVTDIDGTQMTVMGE